MSVVEYYLFSDLINYFIVNNLLIQDDSVLNNVLFISECSEPILIKIGIIFPQSVDKIYIISKAYLIDFNDNYRYDIRTQRNKKGLKYTCSIFF